MTVRAFIMVKTSTPQKMKEYLERLKEIKEVHLVYGGYDVIVVVETGDMGELGRIVLDEIRGRFPVEDTLTLIAAD